MTLFSKDGIVFKRFFLANRCWVVEVVGGCDGGGLRGFSGLFVQGL